MEPLASHPLPLALVLEVVSEVGGTLLVATGVLAGTFRSWAILIELPQERVEWVTAFGFTVGVLATILLVFIELGWR